MPPVVTFLADLGAKVVLTYLGASSVATGVAIAAGTLIVAAGVYTASAALKSLLPDLSMPQADTDKTRQQTVRGTVEPQKVVYGQALVSGPIFFVGVSGDENRDLYHGIALTGHEVEAITDIYFDSEIISNSQITNNAVTSGTFGPKDSETICMIEKKLGTDTQASSSLLTNTFTPWTSAHQGKGVSYIVTKWTLNDGSQEVWDRLKPQNIKALVKGKKDIYDPRLDVAAGNAAGDNPTNAAYQAWTDNPALCTANFLMDAKFGLGVPASKIDWADVVTAADACDVSVVIPNSGTQNRFTANGVIFATDSYRASLNKLLSSMNGSIFYSNGNYRIKAGVYEAPSLSLDEDDLTGPITVKTSVERGERFNTVRPIIIDPAQNHKTSEVPQVQLTSAVSRDNDEVITRDVQLSFTNSSFMAQRIAHKQIQMSDQQKVINFPANLSALNIDIGDRVSVTVAELNYSNKVFRCVNWAFADTQDGAVNLTLVEDDAGSYADPTAGEYSTTTADGTITQGFRGVPDPQNLSATAGLKNIELNWTNPVNTSKFKEIVVYASPNSQWSSKVEIGRTLGTQFFHDASTAADPIAAGDERYYWVRAVAYGTGSGSFVESDRNPDNDTSTINAVCGRVNWVDVAGSTNAPANNATVGATFGTDVDDGAGNIVTFNNVENSVLAQEILQVEVEAGQVLDLESGLDVDIQNLGDVAIYVSDNSGILQGNIDTVSTALSNLEGTVVDLTSGVSDVYVSTTAPVAGVGGIPDPIPTFSRWYDSDDDNHPYYWTSTAWVSLEDPRIGSNSASIASLTSSLNTTNTTVTGNVADITANASAISVLDTTVTNLDGVVSVLSGDNTSLISELKVRFRIQDESDDNLETENDVEVEIESLDNLTAGVSTADQTLETLVTANDAAITSQSVFVTNLSSTVDNAIIDIGTNTTAISANATAVSGLVTRVTATETSITAQSSDITSLGVDLGTAETNLAANATAIGGLDTRVSTAEGTISSLSSDITSLNSSVTTANTNITGNATAIGGLTTRVTATEGSITSQAADITALSVSLTNANGDISANASAVGGLSVRVTATEGSITSQAADITTLSVGLTNANGDITANASAVGGLSVSVSDIEGDISSISTDVSGLTTTVGDNTASINTQATSINGLEAQYTVKIDNNGRVAGFGLASNSRTSEPFSEFVVIADKFSIVNPSSTASTPIIPFQVSGSKISMTGNVEINGSLMVTGSVDTAQLSANAVTQIAQDLNSGNQNFTGSSSSRIFKQIASVTFTSTGAKVQLGGKFMARSYNDQCLCQFRIKRSGTVIFTSQTFSVRPSPEGIHVPIGFVDDNTSTGSRTYTLEAGMNDDQQNYLDAFLFALETKR